MLLLLHSAFMLSVMKMLLKGEVGGRALNSHGNYIVDHKITWKNHGIVFLNFCGNPECRSILCFQVAQMEKLCSVIYYFIYIGLYVHLAQLKHFSILLSRVDNSSNMTSHHRFSPLDIVLQENGWLLGMSCFLY